MTRHLRGRLPGALLPPSTSAPSTLPLGSNPVAVLNSRALGRRPSYRLGWLFSCRQSHASGLPVCRVGGAFR